jgi:peptide deformylase
MYNACGVGLRTIGKAFRLFIIDTTTFSEDEDLSQQNK